jgi:predicted nucleotidyltransferase component of viral defense system
METIDETRWKIFDINKALIKLHEQYKLQFGDKNVQKVEIVFDMNGYTSKFIHKNEGLSISGEIIK